MPLTGSARSAPKPLTSSNPLHSQHLSNDQPKDVENKLLDKNRYDQYVIRNGHPHNGQPKDRYEDEGTGRRGMYEGGGVGRCDQDQDNAEMHELFVTSAGVYYLLAGPRLAEAHNSGTVAPLTGSARSAPKPLTISNLLHT